MQGSIRVCNLQAVLASAPFPLGQFHPDKDSWLTDSWINFKERIKVLARDFHAQGTGHEESRGHERSQTFWNLRELLQYSVAGRGERWAWTREQGPDPKQLFKPRWGIWQNPLSDREPQEDFKQFSQENWHNVEAGLAWGSVWRGIPIKRGLQFIRWQSIEPWIKTVAVEMEKKDKCESDYWLVNINAETCFKGKEIFIHLTVGKNGMA